MIISDKIVYLRKRLGLTQDELAEQLNISRQSVSKWESATSIPDVTKIMAMADLFSVPTDFLLRDEIDTLEGQPIQDKGEKAQIVTIEKAHAFITAHSNHMKIVAIGVFLCITAAAPLIGLQSLVEIGHSEKVMCAIGIVYLFVSVAIAVGLFIYSDSLMNDFNYILKANFELSNNVEGIVKEIKKEHATSYTRNLVFAIGLIILAVIPLILTGILECPGYISTAMVSLLLLLVAIGVFILIRNEGIKEGCERLLSEGEYTKKRFAKNKKKEAIEGAYWGIATAIYLAWSFLTHDWHITWMVWPVAGVLSAVLNLFWMKDGE